MIIVTHEMKFARDAADRILFMDGGVVVEQGDAKELIDHPKEERTRQFLAVHGAEHAVSYYHDNDAYTKQATEFLQDCLARRGFVWPPETDEPEK